MRRFAGDDAQQVVVIGGLAAPRRARFGGRRARAAEPDAAPVEVTRATVVAAGGWRTRRARRPGSRAAAGAERGGDDG